MYQDFYGLDKKPFLVVPNPDFLFLGRQHQDALDHLLFGIQSGEGFILITGEVGTGKTTLGRALIERLDKDKGFRTALIINPALNEVELLASIAEDLGISDPGHTKKEVLDRLHRYLLKEASEGRKVVVIVDEAHKLSPDVLEGLRLLSNLETEEMKLIQMVLLGQSELRGKLQLPQLKPLNQRISIRYHLNPLSRNETNNYIYHRLTVASSKGNIRFSRWALRSIYRYSKGIPRLVNLVCDKALLAGYVSQSPIIKASMVSRAIKSLRGEEERKGLIRPRPAFWGFAVLLGLVFIVGRYQDRVLPHLRAIIGIPNSPAESGLVSSAPEPSAAAAGRYSQRSQQENYPYFDSDGVARGPASSDGAAEAMATVLVRWGIPEQRLRNQISGWSLEAGPFNFRRKALEFGLDALNAEGSLELFEHAGYPSIIELTDSGVGSSYGVLLSLDERSVVVADHLSGRTIFDRQEFMKRHPSISGIIIWKDFDGFHTPLSPGMKGEDVRILQQRLKEAGLFTEFDATGYYGPYTRSVVSRLKKAYRLNDDGIVDALTKAVLYKVLFGDRLPALQTKRTPDEPPVSG